MITLGVDKLEIDWGKNNFFSDHSSLFLPSDVKEIPYYYADDVVENQDGLSRSLGSIKRRLDLLGYSPLRLDSIYREHLENVPDYYPKVSISFEQFKSVIASIDISKIDLDQEYGDYDLGEFVSHYIFRDPEIKKHLPKDINIDSDLGTFFENIDPYFTLRLLAENPENLERQVQWRFSDVVEGGWVERDEIVKPLSLDAKILIVTEGSSDAFIIERSINELMPDIADFFHFVDMEEHYPFTGTGNLYRFCQGLTSIYIQNKVLVLFDNDAAGTESFNKCKKLNCPSNMHICKLPYHVDFEEFKTIGPSGESLENINGSAVAIECFLDLIKLNNTAVRWTSYNRNLKCYQGELENKDVLVREFKKSSLKEGYDVEKLNFLLNYIFDEWVTNAA